MEVKQWANGGFSGAIVGGMNSGAVFVGFDHLTGFKILRVGLVGSWARDGLVVLLDWIGFVGL